MNIPYRDSRLIIGGLILFFVIVLGYAYYEARGVLYGPVIIISPRVFEASDSFIKISGTAERIASLTMNGKPITVTEDGSFDEPYVLVPGYNRIMLEAKDKYGKTATRAIEIVYDPNASAAASSTPSGTVSSFPAISAATTTSSPQ